MTNSTLYLISRLPRIVLAMQSASLMRRKPPSLPLAISSNRTLAALRASSASMVTVLYGVSLFLSMIMITVPRLHTLLLSRSGTASRLPQVPS